MSPDDPSQPERPSAPDSLGAEAPDSGATYLPPRGLEATLPPSASGSVGATMGGRAGGEAASGFATDLGTERYELRRELARGGMGRVLIAYDRHLQREVAIKEMLVDDPETRARFLREVLMTARLQHPSIVSIYESGVNASGQPYYVMRQIPGRPLDALLNERATLPARLELLTNVIATVEALAYAHQQGIIHRDLKPANVMVGRFGETVVIDWGLAKQVTEATAAPGEPMTSSTPIVESASPGDSLRTMSGAVMGTPAYMPPEQARGGTVDARSDVYALGVVLRTLVTGKAPYAGSSVQQVLESVLGGPPPSLLTEQSDAPADLVAIIEKAMAHRPEGRYPLAEDLAQDLQRFANGQLVGARQYTTGERLAHWVQRRRALVSVVGAALAALAVGGAVSVARIMESKHLAEHERDRASQARDAAEGERQRALLEQAKLEARGDPTGAVLTLARLRPDLGGWGEARLVAEDALSQGVASYVLEVPRVTYSRAMAGGNFVALGTEDGDLFLWRRGERSVRRLGNLGGRVMWIDAREGGHFLAFTRAGRVEVWDAPSGSRVAAFNDPSELLLAGLLADGNVFVRRLKGEVALWNLASGREIEQLQPRGDFDSLPGVVLRDAAGEVVVADALGAAHRFELDPEWIFVTGTVRSELVQSERGGLALVDKATGALRRLSASEGLTVLGADLAPDDSVVALTGPRTYRRWDHGAGAPMAGTVDCDARRVSMLGDASVVFGCADTSERADAHDHRSFLASVNDTFGSSLSAGDIYLTRPRSGQILVWELGQVGATVGDGDRLAKLEVGASRHEATVVDSAAGRVDRVDLAHEAVEAGHPLCAAVATYGTSPAGVAWTCASDPDRVHAWAAGASSPVEAHLPGATAIQLSDQGRALVTRAGGASWLDVASGATQAIPAAAGMSTVYLFGDGRLIAGAQGNRGSMAVLDPAGAPVATLASDWRSFAQLSHDRSTLLWGEMDGTLHLWSMGDRRDRTFNLHGPNISAADVSADGRTLVAGDWEGNLREWDIATGAPQQVWPGQGGILEVAITGDGQRAAVGGAGGAVRLVDLASGSQWALRLPDGASSEWALLDSPASIITVQSGRLRVWDDGLPLEPEPLLARLRSRPIEVR